MDLDRRLVERLREFPYRHQRTWDEKAQADLLLLLYQSLCRWNSEYLVLLFNKPYQKLKMPWSLSKELGAVEGTEYTAAAKGKPCGHILKNVEPIYRCRTCSTDDTCVLCSRCFQASDHEGHQVYLSLSSGTGGCCDCGDPEAWRRPIHCSIHSAEDGSRNKGKAIEHPPLPEAFLQSIQITISRALDYFVDVLSCAPEQLRMKKSRSSVMEDERRSRLTRPYYSDLYPERVETSFCLILWNDDKHNLSDVCNALARAVKMKKGDAYEMGRTAHNIGRALIKQSDDLDALVDMAEEIERTKFAVTIRSARDTFRERMCETILAWLSDIAGCAVGPDTHVIRRTICAEMLKPWRKGSQAHKQEAGVDGLFDWEEEERPHPRIQYNDRRTGRRNATAVPRRAAESDDDDDDDDIDDEDDDAGADDDGDEMDVDGQGLRNNGHQDEQMDDALEQSEATIAGYPQPPLPPARGAEYFNPNLRSQRRPREVDYPIRVPRAPKVLGNFGPVTNVPQYWLDRPEGYKPGSDLPACEDLWQDVRIDWMIIHDLRMWRNLRLLMRDLFIGTVVNVPDFKRLLGIRFAKVYTALAQLYLIADREPDHSIISLSVQMLTTPTITEEVIERGNFLTNLMAIIYTFMTTRQVGWPREMNVNATLTFDAGITGNRRLTHFFQDIRHLLVSPLALRQMRLEERYFLQFLDLIKLFQGIVPNVRQLGDHVEFENDHWFTAMGTAKEVNRLCRQVGEAFTWAGDRNNQSPENMRLIVALRQAAKIAIINSLGAERGRFTSSEIKEDARFKTIVQYDFEDNAPGALHRAHHIVDFDVAKGHMSFHHPLHYMVSWLIEKAKMHDATQIRQFLTFSTEELKTEPTPAMAYIPSYFETEHIMILFDMPLRVCAWLSQMKAKIWVRNGLTLSHQASQYRNVSQRDFTHHRDIFMLQTALVVCDPSEVLATMIDRFGMTAWVKGQYTATHTIEKCKTADVAEDFVHLLVILLSERMALFPRVDETTATSVAVRREIAEVLCFKPLSHSALAAHITERSREAECYEDVLREMADFRPPGGANDPGLFELKKRYIESIDVYTAPYSRNQREEAELIYCKHMSQKLGKPIEDIVFEPTLAPIDSGLFKDLAKFTSTPLFAQIIYSFLNYIVQADSNPSGPSDSKDVPFTKIDGFLHLLLHLVLISIAEDPSTEESILDVPVWSFAFHVITLEASRRRCSMTILSLLQAITEREEFENSNATIRLIFSRLRAKRPREFATAADRLGIVLEQPDIDSPKFDLDQDKERKKQDAQARAAQAIAKMKEQQKSFLEQQVIDWGDDGDDLSDVDGDAMDTPPESNEWRFPSDTCIHCQGACNEEQLYGTFSFIIDSNILRQTPQNDPQWIAEVFDLPQSLNRHYDRTRPFGVAGQNHEIKVFGDGKKIDQQILGKGFPSECALWGPVATGCGHLMHYKCFDVYLTATDMRHRSQTARHQPEDRKLRQFLCPYCKALGNLFLPIIWKPKTLSYPGELLASSLFDEWVCFGRRTQSLPPFRLAGLRGSGFCDKAAPHPSIVPSLVAGEVLALLVTSRDYISRSIIPRFANSIPGGELPPTVPVPVDRNQPHLGSLPVYSAAPVNQPAASGPSANNTVLPSAKLYMIYSAISKIISTQDLQGKFSPSRSFTIKLSNDFFHCDVLARTLGCSISATEIASRGTFSGRLVVDGISEQVKTHLRILSETVTAYLALGVTKDQGSNFTASEYLQMQQENLKQLLFGFQPAKETFTLPNKNLTPLLEQDAFLFLSSASVFLVPSVEDNVYPILRLAYTAEIVRVIISYGWRPDTKTVDTKVFDNVRRKDPLATRWSCDATQEDNFARFAAWIYGQCKYAAVEMHQSDHVMQILQQIKQGNFLAQMRDAISSYVLVFLRKAAILMLVRFNVDFSLTDAARGVASEDYMFDDDNNGTELDRLVAALQLPNLNDIVSSIADTSAAGHAQRTFLSGWIQHWIWALEGRHKPPDAMMLTQSGQARFPITLSHPGIFELIGLPKRYATLADAAISLKCPNSGTDLGNPLICLWCGEIFCGQAVCCAFTSRGQSVGNVGGAHRHRLKCGKAIGMFIDIRKCQLVLVCNKNGSYFPAPYMDEYGEVDGSLRRSNQLFLHQGRLDGFARQLWLTHGIPNILARKLESEHNTGGWDTL